MKKLLLLLVCSCAISLSAQQANVWRFGNGAGLDFNTGSPVALPAGPMNTTEACATACDNQGQLLFYTNGVTVWNRNNVVMPNGTGLTAGTSTTQTLIVQKPGDCSKYYIFHAGDHLMANNGYYSVVDMCLNGGLGDVVVGSKNILLYNNFSERMTAVKHSNGTDVWILTHELGSANFRTYLLTAAGLSAPLIQSIGSQNPASCLIGYMKASHNGQKIVSAAPFNCSFLDMFDFNPSTGQLSSFVDLASIIGANWYYSMEFSPNDQLLYLADLYVTSSVVQLNLANYATVTLASLGGNYQYGAVQLAPDGKIYVARTGQNYLAVINNPNVLGTGCGYVNNGVTLAAGTTAESGLPNFAPFVLTQLNPQFVSLGSDTTLNCASPHTLAPLTACNSTYLWSDLTTNDSFVVNTQGTYWVEVTNVCGTSRDTIVVSGTSGSPNAQFVYSVNGQCGLPVTFTNTSSGATSYSWSFGDNTTSTLQNPTHTYLGTGVFQVVLIISGPCGNDTTVGTITINPTTTISQFTSSGTACGSPVTFTNTSSSATSYYWDFGDLTNSTATSPTHTYTSPGTYQVMLIATSPCDIDTSYGLITIVPTTVTAAFSSVPSVCVGNPIFFSNTSVGATSSAWDFGDLSTSTATSPAHTYASPGTYAVTLIASGGCGADTITQVITINAVPVAAITGADTICIGQTITLSASGGGSYQWSGGNTSTTASISVSPTVTTAYYVQVSNGACTSIPDTHIVVVNSAGAASISGATTICVGQTITLTASGATTYQWSGGSSATTPSIVVSPVTTTTYYVAPSGSCGGTPDTHVVVVVPVPVVNAGGNTTICTGQSTTMTASGGGSYQWSGGSTDTTASITVSPVVTTTYFVTASNGFCTSGFDTITVVVLPSPTVTIAAPSAICAGTTLTLTAVGTATTWVWSGGASGTGTTITDNPTGSTNYYLIGYNAQGCSDTDMVTVGVFDTPTFAIQGDDTLCIGESSTLLCTGNGSFTWSPATGLNSTTSQTVIASPTTTITYSVQVTDINGCTGSDSFTLVVDPCTGIEEETAEPGISVFPNPSTGVYSINLNTTQPVVVEVFNALGQVIVSETVTMADGTPYLLDMSEAAEGNYLLKVTGETGVETHKLQLIR